MTLVGGTGGTGLRRVKTRLDAGGVDVLIATTGRLLQLMDAREIDIRFSSHVVVDEVDTMLDEGFGLEVRRIVAQAESKLTSVQLVAVGATHPPEAQALYQDLMPRARPVAADLHRTPTGLEQRFVRVAPTAKVAELLTLLRGVRGDARSGSHVMVFVNSVDATRFVHHVLSDSSMVAACVHGAMPATKREREYARFRGDGENPAESAHVLVATDVAGRGVDDVGVAHVILFDFPRSAVDYVHRYPVVWAGAPPRRPRGRLVCVPRRAAPQPRLHGRLGARACRRLPPAGRRRGPRHVSQPRLEAPPHARRAGRPARRRPLGPVAARGAV